MKYDPQKNREPYLCKKLAVLVVSGIDRVGVDKLLHFGR